MPMGAGKDREWLAPLTPEGNRDTDDPALDGMVGCHTGQYVHLNILNAQPGFEYIWERNTGRDLLKARQRGGIPVSADDPELAAMNQIMTEGPGGATALDSSNVYGDVRLFKYPIERIRQIRETERARAEASMRGGAADFADKATAIEAQLSRGLPTRFARHDHGMTLEDSKGRSVDHWAPEDGITRVRES